MNRNIFVTSLLVAFVLLMSLPWLVPGMGWTALIGFVPLLLAQRVAERTAMKRFGLWSYVAFLVWNAITTWWVCKATVGGGIAASVVNAGEMWLVFGAFRLFKKKFKGAVPYIFLAVAWIAWERFYLTVSQISWPWLVLGNAFARTTRLVQWYEVTGTLGGSLWIWAVNCGLFGIVTSIAEGSWRGRPAKARTAAVAALAALVLGPVAASLIRYSTYDQDSSEGTLKAVVIQPNYDPWVRANVLPQRVQTEKAVSMLENTVGRSDSSLVLYAFPETFITDIWLNDPEASTSWRRMEQFLKDRPNANAVFGAVTREYFFRASPPSANARRYGPDAWYEAHNSVFVLDRTGRTELYHKSKLVVGTESLPYPKLLGGINRALGDVAGHYVTQSKRTPLSVCEYEGDSLVRSIPVGVGICYESVYGEHMTGFVRAGAQAIVIITNDGWWGNTSGYRQHFSYSRLRAIEMRRDLVRCANTGISAFIDQKGDVLKSGPWWQADVIDGTLALSSHITPFVKYGDVTGRACVLATLLLALAFVVRLFTRK